VLVRFGRQVAQNVAEVSWHKTQQMQFNEDGTLDFRVTVSGLNEISWWILGYGDQAEVIEPPELRKIIADRVKRMAEVYK
jgi:proteasome accessory factor B